MKNVQIFLPRGIVIVLVLRLWYKYLHFTIKKRFFVFPKPEISSFSIIPYIILHLRRCKTSSVGQSAGLSILRSSVRFRQKIKKTENPNLHAFEVHRPSNKGTKLLLQVIKAIIHQFSFLLNFQIGPSQISQSGLFRLRVEWPLQAIVWNLRSDKFGGCGQFGGVRKKILWFSFVIFPGRTNWDVRDDHKLLVFSSGTVKSMTERSQSRLKFIRERSWYKLLPWIRRPNIGDHFWSFFWFSNEQHYLSTQQSKSVYLLG